MSLKNKLAKNQESPSIRPLAIGFYEDDVEKLDQLAQAFGRSRSAVVRILVHDGISRLDVEMESRE